MQPGSLPSLPLIPATTTTWNNSVISITQQHHSRVEHSVPQNLQHQRWTFTGLKTSCVKLSASDQRTQTLQMHCCKNPISFAFLAQHLSTTTAAAAQSVNCISLLNVLQVRFGKIGYWQLWSWSMRLGPAPSYECTISAQCISVCRIFTVCTFYALITSREDHAPINIDGSSPEWSEWLS